MRNHEQENGFRFSQDLECDHYLHIIPILEEDLRNVFSVLLAYPSLSQMAYSLTCPL